MTELYQEEIKKALDPMFEQLLAMAKYRYGKKNLQDYALKYKFVDPLSADDGTHQPKHFGFEMMMINQMNNRDYAFEIYRENIRDDFVFDGDEQTIWQTKRSIPNTKDYLFMPLFNIRTRKLQDIGLKRVKMSEKEADDYLKFANFADHAIMDDLDDRISLNFALERVFDEYTKKFVTWAYTD